MRAIIKYYIKGKRNAITIYVEDLKFNGLLDIAANAPVDPDHISKFYICADFEYEKPKQTTLEEFLDD